MQASTSYSTFNQAQPRAGPGMSPSGSAQLSSSAGSNGAGADRKGKGRVKPKVLFIGAREVGKSSIHKVVFEHMAPSDTIFIEKKDKNTTNIDESFISIDMFDLPGGPLDPSQWPVNFASFDSVVFVVDAQSAFRDVSKRLGATIQRAFAAKPDIWFDVFLHKVDKMSEEYKLDLHQTVRDAVDEDLFEAGLGETDRLAIHLTTVYDGSIYEALSRVVQKLVPEQAALEQLLDLACDQSGMDKAFLFDTNSKLYLATDSRALDEETYTLCSDFLDLVGDFGSLYDPSPVRSPSHSRSPSTTQRASAAAPLSPLPQSLPAPTPGSTTLPSSKVRLASGAALAQWTISPDLCLVGLLKPHAVERHAALVEFNVDRVRDAVLAVFGVGVGL